MNDRYDWQRDPALKRERDPREDRSADYSGEQQWGRENGADRYASGNQEYRRESGRDAPRGRSGYEPRYGTGYGSGAQTGDYFGPGDYGSGSHAYSANWDRGYGVPRNSYGVQAGGYGATRQPVQRDARNWGDRQMGSDYEPGEGYAREDGHRSFLDRAADEVMSWWGDDGAARRREEDRREDHRGRGPADYTRSDERIREDANDRLTDDWQVDARQISIAVESGEVTLSGSVPTRQEKHRAEECVERISGVKHVQNNLRVDQAREKTSGYRTDLNAAPSRTAPTAASLGGAAITPDNRD
ncbi:BON domain-containing protein [Novosphingobium sp. KCTC 2891]|uniref:BON domain-containing protein n=1 Tax=Novosphingobium sp. KCTC 2891 TaxID=2989730 RepID=UPI002223C0F6|nr:BON domain-containing protein [Novosphingobium sp. KCTC 2891]MCW1382373.1 BON domain-containing protein [Novosphingobium sp. KCTC 2891]